MRVQRSGSWCGDCAGEGFDESCAGFHHVSAGVEVALVFVGCGAAELRELILPFAESAAFFAHPAEPFYGLEHPQQRLTTLGIPG